jgi:hypothetical protein
MKPNFALSLSFEGIRLLHRAAGGWRLVGEVALDSTDLAGEITALRKQAEAIAPDGVRTKLILPNDQIKYLSIETGDIFEEARDTAARAALASATPYDVSDLVYDTCIDGSQTHIAAVAKETLAEAEAFAVEHLLYPVSFAAIPGENPFLGEPFFGPAEAASRLLPAGETVEPDGIAVVVVGKVEPKQEKPKVPGPAPKKAKKKAPAKPLKEPGEKVAGVSDTASTDIPDTAPDHAEKAQTATQPDNPEPVTLPPLRSAASSSVTQTAPPVAPEPDAPEEPLVGFASRRSETPEKRISPPLTSPAPAAETQPAPTITAPSHPLRAERAPDLSVTSGRIAGDDPKPVAFRSPEKPGNHPAPATEKKSILSGPKSAMSALAKSLPKRSEPKTSPKRSTKSASPAPEATPSEAERMTVFGARQSEVGGKPRFLGLILTAVLLVFLAGVAAWASVFLDDGLNLSRLFGDRTPQTTESILETDPKPALLLPDEPEQDADVQLVALQPDLTPEDDAVLEALSTPIAEPPAQEETPLSDAELAERYAVSGIWPFAPDVPPNPAGLINIDNLYLTRIEDVSAVSDAVALPAAARFDTDIVLAAIGNPAAPGTTFRLDARGLVVPTARGALSPDGITVFAGRPPITPPATPTRFNAAPVDTVPRDTLSTFRPRTRPENLEENRERAQLGGVTFDELAGFRPALRPLSQQEQALAALNTDDAVASALATPEGIASASTFATAASVRPDQRPENFAAIAERTRPQQEEVLVASAAGIAPRTVIPDIPTSASVSRQATVRNAINLRKVNLIGVYGKPSERRALVRLSSGRYKKVVVGDRIDGGRVSAIGDSELRYVKNGRNLVLKMPR